jgi:hypothetical protein
MSVLWLPSFPFYLGLDLVEKERPRFPCLEGEVLEASQHTSTESRGLPC